MVPLRVVARARAPRLISTSALRIGVPSAASASPTPIAGPSRCAAEYLAWHARPSLHSQVRALHSSLRSLKDKRWVNSAQKAKEEAEEGEGEEAEGETATKEETSATEPTKGKDKDVKTKVVEAEASETAKTEEKSAAEAESKTKQAASSTSASGVAPPEGVAATKSAGSGKGKEIAKPSIPEIYPQVLALPITRRPLFPGFYKAVTITSPAVIKAIRELIAHGQPYIGAFLLKDSDSDSDVITSLDQVHPVGVFAQITSVFSSADTNRQQNAETDESGEPKPETLTAVLYPHRRIHIDELVVAGPPEPPVVEAVEAEAVEAAEAKEEAEVASFEKEVPSVEETKEALGETAEDAEAKDEDLKHQSQIGFLHPLLPEISLTNVSNLVLEPHKKDNQVIRAIMGEILAVFKEIAQLQPIFREQSE